MAHWQLLVVHNGNLYKNQSFIFNTAIFIRQRLNVADTIDKKGNGFTRPWLICVIRWIRWKYDSWKFLSCKLSKLSSDILNNSYDKNDRLNLRSNIKIIIPKLRLTLVARTPIIVLPIKLFIKLLNSIKKISSMKNFVTEVKAFLLEACHRNQKDGLFESWFFATISLLYIN